MQQGGVQSRQDIPTCDARVKLTNRSRSPRRQPLLSMTDRYKQMAVKALVVQTIVNGDTILKVNEIFISPDASTRVRASHILDTPGGCLFGPLELSSSSSSSLSLSSSPSSLSSSGQHAVSFWNFYRSIPSTCILFGNSKHSVSKTYSKY